MEAQIGLTEGKAIRPKLTPLVIFGGFSNAGKTTYATSALRNLGYRVHSSSSLLHGFSQKLLQIMGIEGFDTYNRQSYLNVVSRASKIKGLVLEDCVTNNQVVSLKSRDLLIEIAEKALVPTFSRSVFAHQIAEEISFESGAKHAIEVFKAEEFSRLQTCLKQKTKLVPRCFNLRRATENSAADSRSLIPLATDIFNDGTYDDLVLKLEKFLS